MGGAGIDPVAGAVTFLRWYPLGWEATVPATLYQACLDGPATEFAAAGRCPVAGSRVSVPGCGGDRRAAGGEAGGGDDHALAEIFDHAGRPSTVPRCAWSGTARPLRMLSRTCSSSCGAIPAGTTPPWGRSARISWCWPAAGRSIWCVASFAGSRGRSGTSGWPTGSGTRLRARRRWPGKQPAWCGTR